MQASSLAGAFEIVPLVGAGIEGDPVAGVSQALVSDGRVLVLLLVGNTLPASDYIVRIAEGGAPLDLTGQALGLAEFSQLGNFNVGSGTAVPAAPRLVTAYPPDGADNQSETSEIVAVFDRPVLEASVDRVSFDVKVKPVGSGTPADPANDPSAAALVLGSGLTDTRVFLYRSLDGDGLPAPLGTDFEVTLALSPASHPIKEMDGGALAADTISFDTLPFEPPMSASLMSVPHDAIGLANLTDGDVQELTIVVEFDDDPGAQPNDSVDLFLFGVQKSVQQMPPLIALQRSVRLQGNAPIQVATFTREDVGLQLSNDPTNTRLNDGSVTFAFRARRAGLFTPVRVLDLDPDPETIEDPLLDTVRPTIEGLVGSASTSLFRSDQRGLSLAGTADEDLSIVEVSTMTVTNDGKPVVGTTPVGTMGDHLFLAAQVPLGVLEDGDDAYTAVAHDLALNSSPAVSGTYTQLGAVGPGPFMPGDTILVEVFDSRTLAPLSGTLVLVHSDRGNAFPFIRSGTTGTDGRISLVTEGDPSIGAIITVVRAGYDLFTLHDTPFTRLSVPLRESNRTPSHDTGLARSSDTVAVLTLPGLGQRFDDSRRALELPRGFPERTCGSSGGILTCTHDSEDIRPGRLCARSFFAGVFGQTEFQSSQILRAFALALPLEPTDPGESQPGELSIPFLLDDPSTPEEERVEEVPAFIFQVDAGSGVDLGNLDGDPDTIGGPRVSVDALVPGLPGSIAVSLGLAFDLGGGQWNVRAVLPGAITLEGSLGSAGRIDTNPFVRVEALDVHGNAAGARPRLSNIPKLPDPPGVFRALAVPTQLAPAEDGTSGGEAFTVLLTHAIDRAVPGLYRVDLLDSAGRVWSLFRVDPPSGAAPVELRVVDVADAGVAGVTGLASGSLESRTSAYAWTSMGTSGFLLSDLEREFELFSRAAPLTFTKP